MAVLTLVNTQIVEPYHEDDATKLRRLYQELQQANVEHRQKGLAFGQFCYELREKHKAQGSRTGGGLEAVLDKLDIPSSTAYKWIARHEEAHGLRLQPSPRVEEVEAKKILHSGQDFEVILKPVKPEIVEYKAVIKPKKPEVVREGITSVADQVVEGHLRQLERSLEGLTAEVGDTAGKNALKGHMKELHDYRDALDKVIQAAWEGGPELKM